MTKLKEKRRVSTLQQVRVAEEIVKNAKSGNKLNKTQIVRNSGYTETSAVYHAPLIIAQAGVQNALKDLGFSLDGAKAVVQEIMYNKEVVASSRLQATDQVFKVTGGYSPDKHINVNVEVTEDDAVKELTKRLNSVYRNETPVEDTQVEDTPIENA